MSLSRTHTITIQEYSRFIHEYTTSTQIHHPSSFRSIIEHRDEPADTIVTMSRIGDYLSPCNRMARWMVVSLVMA